MFSHAGDSAPFVVDNATSPSGESVVLPWNAEWIGGNANATVVITDNGAEVKRATGIGELTLNDSFGYHLLEYSTFIGGVKQGETYTAEVELIHIKVESKVAKVATCTEDGWTHEVKCSRCNAVLEASTILPNLGGHVTVETKAAKATTCTEAGWTHEVKCSRCNAVLETSTTIPALGHVRRTTVTAIEPTCTVEGRTAEVVCTRCNAMLEVSSVVPALGHARQTTISAIEPTCTADGRTAKVVCSRCGITFETSEVVPALGHSGAITKPAVEPTSSTAGATAEITCTRCGTVLQEQTALPALGYIRNVTAQQIWPFKKVEVCYEVAEDIGDVRRPGVDAARRDWIVNARCEACHWRHDVYAGIAPCDLGHVFRRNIRQFKCYDIQDCGWDVCSWFCHKDFF